MWQGGNGEDIKQKGSNFLILISDGYNSSSDEEPERLSDIAPTYAYTDLKAIDEEDPEPNTDIDKDSDEELRKESDDDNETEEDMDD